MANVRKLDVQFTADTSGAARGFRAIDDAAGKTERSMSSLGGKLASIGKTIAVGLGVAGVAAVGFGLSAVQAAEDAAKVTGQTDAVIKSMGLSASVTGDQIAGLAEKLSLKAGIDDELIQSGANVMLTFRSVAQTAGQTGGVFDRATAAALDMSVALGTDMNSAAMMVGKALNDPVAGLTALRRSGIQFTDQQEDQIRAMTAAGDVAGAQAIMLRELEAQFGGSAAAQATASDRMQVAWGNLQEKIGEKLLPAFEAFTEWVTSTAIPALGQLADWVEGHLVPSLQDFGMWLSANILPALQAVGSFIVGTIVPALVQFAQWLGDNKTVMAAVAIGITAVLVPAFIAWAVAAGAAAIATLAAAAPFILVGAAIAAFAYLVITHWDTIKSATLTAFNAVKDAIAAAFNWVKTNWPLLLAILTGPIGMAVLLISRNWETIKSGVTAVKDWIVARFGDVLSFITGLPGAIASAAAGMWDGITDAFRSAINAIIGLWNNFSISFGGYDIPGPGPNIPSFTIDTPNIPYLAQGGIVPASPGGTLAVLGEGGRDEAVIPLDRHGAGVGSTTIHNHFHIAGSIWSERELVAVLNRQADVGNKLNVRVIR